MNGKHMRHQSICLSAVMFIALLIVLLAPLSQAFADTAGETQPSQVSIAPQCVAPKVVKKFQSCSGVLVQKTAKKSSKPESRFRSVKRKKKASKKKGASGPSITIDMATRRNKKRVQLRAWSLLQREVQVLNRLVRNTPRSNSQRPDILLRLAETYFEMQVVLKGRVRSYDEPLYNARRRKQRSKYEQLVRKQRQTESQLEQVRKQTISSYAKLIKDHPNYERKDEVLFSLAFSLEESGEFDKAREVYLALISQFPASRFVPNAYLSFAEYYFNEGEMPNALKLYSKVLEYPPEKNALYGFALYKSAWAHYNNDDFKESLSRFVNVIAFAEKYPNAHDVANLQKQARRELVMPYSRSDARPDAAYSFFLRHAKDEAQALKMFESLAEIYYDDGQWAKALYVYRKLINDNRSSDRVCYWQSQVTNAVISSQPKKNQVEEVKNMVTTYESYVSRSEASAQLKQQCKQETASVLVWLATTWHRETVGTNTQPGTKDKNTMRLAASIYKLILRKFPDLEKMSFPQLDRRDWPTKYKVAYYHAELLWKMEDWHECGPAFDKVVEMNPKGAFASDAAYAAVLCYNNLYQTEYTKREKVVRKSKKKNKGQTELLKPRSFTEVEAGMINAFHRYTCFVKNSDDLPTIKYRRARIFYEANHFEEAAYLFRDIAWNHSKSDLAVYAANLYLDSLNALATMGDSPRSACIRTMGDSLEPLTKTYCSDSQYDKNQDLCEVVDQLRCDVLRKEAEVYEKEKNFKRAASTYVRIYRRYQECGQLDEVLYNSAINFEAARLLGRAIQVRTELIRKFPNSRLAKKAIYLIGANFHALAFYEQAAKYYEEFASRFPGEDGKKCSDDDVKSGTCPVAHEALMNAVFFRLGLSQTDKAIEDARLFERNYKRSMPDKTARVIFSVGTIYKRRQDWNRLVSHYGDFTKRYKRTALPSHIMRAYVDSGNAFWERDDRKRARGYYDIVVKMWKGGVLEAIKRKGSGSVEDRTAFYEAGDAVSEALFHLAEYAYADFKAIRFPRYSSKVRSAAKVTEWANKAFAPWVVKKGNALKAAEKQYNTIAGLDIPQWQIAAAARVGEMYRSFVDEFRDAPIPKEIEEDPELYDIYVGALDQKSEPFQKQAIEKFEYCLITATRVRWFNKWSRQCEGELNRLNPRQYPLAAELRGRANHLQVTFGEPRGASLNFDEIQSLSQPSAGGKK